MNIASLVGKARMDRLVAGNPQPQVCEAVAVEASECGLTLSGNKDDHAVEIYQLV